MRIAVEDWVVVSPDQVDDRFGCLRRLIHAGAEKQGWWAKGLEEDEKRT